MKSFGEYLIYSGVKNFGGLVRVLPLGAALWLGRRMGDLGYLFDRKHRSLAYANLKIAFVGTQKPRAIKRLVKQVFQNYGQNLMELFRLPLIAQEGIEKFVTVEGKEHVHEALKKGKGVILLAMHFGSWELSSFMGMILGHPYNVLAKPQKRYSRLDDLLNSFRKYGGSQVIARGTGTREVIEGLRKNEIIGMVVDQGGKDGALIKFFGRQAAMSVGAIRLGLKFDVPILFSLIARQDGKRGQHKLIIHPPLELVKTGQVDQDVVSNLNKVNALMERYIEQYPSEYMWFYKIWKYSKESNIVIVDDGKAGHLRQSQAVADTLRAALAGRGIESQVTTLHVQFKNRFARACVTVLSCLLSRSLGQGRVGCLRWFLDKGSFERIISTAADYVISAGSAAGGINFWLSSENRAKSIGVLRALPNRFDLNILPQHDCHDASLRPGIVVIKGAANLIDDQYLQEQSAALAERFPLLKKKGKFRIGLFLGGETKHEFLPQGLIYSLIHQVKGAASHLSADILLTTSRRTPESIAQIVSKETKDDEIFPLVVIANRKNVPEAVGGILGLCQVVIVSGDSISMVSEAVSSGKNTIVFRGRKKSSFPSMSAGKDKHGLFLKNLSDGGYIYLTHEKNIGQLILDMAKGKLKTRRLDDRAAILEGLKRII